jgi:diguanylate cyclase (GGDEF)-like protein
MSLAWRHLVVRMLLALLLSSAFGVQALPAPPAPETLAEGRVDLTPFVGLIEDPNGDLPLSEVRRRFYAGETIPAKLGGVNLGYSRSAWWIGFRPAVANAIPLPGARQHLLEVAFPTLDRIEFYSPGSVTPVITGDLVPFAQRPIAHRNFVFDLPPAMDAADLVLLRVRSEGTVSVPLTLWSPTAFADYSRVTYAGLAVYFGAVLALLVYNALLWLSIRERMYLDYVLFVGGLAIGLAGFNGLGNEFIWSAWPGFANLAFPLGFSLCSLGVAQFTRSFLSPQLVSPRLDFLLRAGGLLSIATAVVTLGFSYMLGGKMLTVATVSTTSLATLTGLYCLLRKVPAARLFMLAWSLFMLFGIAFALRNYGLIPTNFLTLHGLQFGSVIGMLLLSFALADRIQTERRAKEAAQAEALAAKQLNIENLQRSEHELEQRVAARTAELAAANERLLTSEQQQRDLAQHDMLTGLANRALFSDRLNQALVIAQRDHTRFALLYLDLDKFKPVNDNYGHAVGDVLLKEVALRMTQRVRESDTVARIGGDEFVILLRAIDAGHGEITVAESIRNSLNQPFQIENHPIAISCSIGIAIYPDHGRTEAELSRQADAAMYRAKEAGRDTTCVAGR